MHARTSNHRVSNILCHFNCDEDLIPSRRLLKDELTNLGKTCPLVVKQRITLLPVMAESGLWRSSIPVTIFKGCGLT